MLLKLILYYLYLSIQTNEMVCIKKFECGDELKNINGSNSLLLYAKNNTELSNESGDEIKNINETDSLLLYTKNNTELSNEDNNLLEIFLIKLKHITEIYKIRNRNIEPNNNILLQMNNKVKTSDIDLYNYFIELKKTDIFFNIYYDIKFWSNDQLIDEIIKKENIERINVLRNIKNHKEVCEILLNLLEDVPENEEYIKSLKSILKDINKTDEEYIKFLVKLLNLKELDRFDYIKMPIKNYGLKTEEILIQGKKANVFLEEN